MTLFSKSFFALLLAVSLLCSQGHTAPNLPPKTISGVATSPDGKPLPGVTLYMLDLPPGSYIPDLGEGGKVVTDGQGHFTWNVPIAAWGHVITNPDAVDSSVPSVYAFPQDQSWKIRVSLTQGSKSQSGARELLTKATKATKNIWLATGENPPLSVVVPERGSVDLLIRSPEGRPLINHPVELVSPDQFSNSAGAVVYEGRTDAIGHLHWQGFTGRQRLLISVPGIGFGSTGTFDVVPNQVVSPSTPPLAAFARLSGTVAPQLNTAGAIVRANYSSLQEHQWMHFQGALDASNRFTIRDLLPGLYTLSVGGESSSFEASSSKNVVVRMRPGENRTGITIDPAPTPTPSPSNKVETKRPRPRLFPGGEEGKSAVSGRVTDAAGQPVAGADVYAIYSYFGAIRQYQSVLTSKTQPDGTYSISGLTGTRVSLVAVQEGRPLAFALARSIKAKANDSASSDIAHLSGDLVFASGHPQLSVRVLDGGKPLAGAFVRLTPQVGAGLFSANYMGSIGSEARGNIAELVEPTSTTNADGEVTFTNLIPGLWNITATAGDKQSLDYVEYWFADISTKAHSNFVPSVAVQEDRPRQVTIDLYPRPEGVTLQLLSLEGIPPASANASVSYGLASSPYLMGGGGFGVDKEGRGTYRFERSGLWHIRTYFRDIPGESISATAEPYYQGDTWLAISPAFPRTEPVVLPSTRRERARLRVQLEDEKGRPANGSVWIGDTWDPARYAASVIPKIPTTFADMPSGSYSLRASLDKYPPLPELGEIGTPFPKDVTLRGIRRVLSQDAIVQAGEETLVTFRPQLQGYVRGRVVAPDGAKYWVNFGYDNEIINSRYDSATGEFVAGPFAPGKINVYVERADLVGEESRNRGESFTVSITAGEVTHITLAPKFALPPAQSEATTVLLTMGGILNLNSSSPSAATVLLSDGKTPAWGAVSAVFAPQTWQPIQMARADALGQLNPVEHGYTNDAPMNPPSGSPTEPVMAVWLPGSTGAIIVPASSKSNTSIILPEPVSLQGHITVGRKPFTGNGLSFHVLAAYQGKGKLNALLSVQATVEPDGTFTLAGLTPGTYQVQAERDGIWLSATQELTVGKQPLDDLTFDIPEPGAPTIIHLVAGKGEPLRNQSVLLDRPVGPFTSSLWPKTLTTDARGDLRLEGWEPGTHSFQLAPQKATPSTNGATFTVTIPPFSPGSPMENQKVIVR